MIDNVEEAKKEVSSLRSKVCRLLYRSESKFHELQHPYITSPYKKKCINVRNLTLFLLIVILGMIGSLLGWYAEDVTTSLSRPISETRLGFAMACLAFMVIFNRVFNFLVFRD